MNASLNSLGVGDLRIECLSFLTSKLFLTILPSLLKLALSNSRSKGEDGFSIILYLIISSVDLFSLYLVVT